jgi:esterase/lipase superfamily enzyme
MEAKAIKKISEAELTEAALAYAHNVTKVIEGSGRSDQKFLDSLDKVYDVEVIFMTPKDTKLRSVERQVIEAYVSTIGSDAAGENLQKMGNDSLLFTKPQFRKSQKGTLEFNKALALRIHKKAVILSIKN